MSGSKIIPKSNLPSEQIQFLESAINSTVGNVALLGAVLGLNQEYQPVFLQGRQLRILKLTTKLLGSGQALIGQLADSYLDIRKYYPDLVQKTGVWEGRFFILRTFHRSTLAEYLEQNNIGIAEANNLILKILSLMMDLRRINFPHGHISPNNIVIDEKKLSFIDHAFSFHGASHQQSSEFLAPEVGSLVVRDFASDVYSLSKLIRYLYRGLQCPIPLDLYDAMGHQDPKRRPDMLEVYNQISDVFTQKPNPTEHWKNAPVIAAESDPSQLYKGYLTPALIEQIREHFIRSSQTTDKPVVSAESKIGREITRRASSFNPIIFLVVAVLILSIFYLFGRNASDQSVVTKATSESAQLSETVILTIKYLEEKKVAEAIEYASVLTSFSNSNYSEQLLLQFIKPLEAEEFQLSKLKALVLLLGSNTELLSAVMPDLEKNKILGRYLNWFKTNGILNWAVVNPLYKLLIITGDIPGSLLDLNYLFDLTQHFDSTIREAVLSPLLKAIKPAEQGRFYQVILAKLTSFDRESLSFLNLALSSKPELQLALLEEWFKNTKPDQGLIFELVLSRAKPAVGEDYFSYLASRYLKDYLLKLPSSELQKLKDHHEKQLSVYAQIKGKS